MVFPLRLLPALCLLVAFGPVVAKDVPRPKLKPAPFEQPLTPVVLPPVMAKDLPRPKLKPAPFEQPSTPVVLPPVIAIPRVAQIWPTDIVATERALCARVLQGLDLTYEILAPIGGPEGCGTPAPILIKSIRGTRIAPPAEVTCAFAVQMHGWVTASLQPAALAIMGQELVQIDNASAYVCRRRNNAASGKLSEHAKANALDISNLRFAGKAATSVKSDWSDLEAKIGQSKKAQFLARIRSDACIRFTTVLGPGSDIYHGDHFHLDHAQRKNDYRICK